MLSVALTGLMAPAQAKDCVGIVAAGVSPFWHQVEAGARLAGKQYGVAIHFRGPTHDGQVASQLKMIDGMLGRGCQALVIAPSGAGIAPRVEQLAAKGINTIYFDRDLPGSGARALVATDNFRAGQQAGRSMASALGGRGSVGLLRLQPGVQSTSERERGFRQGAEAGGLVVLVDTYVGDDSEAAVVALHAHLEQLDGVFTPNSVSTRTALAALRRMGKAGKLLHIGFDSDSLLIEALRAGDIHSLFIQQSQAIGYQAVKLAVQALRGTLQGGRVHIALEASEVDQAGLVQWEQSQAFELSSTP